MKNTFIKIFLCAIVLFSSLLFVCSCGLVDPAGCNHLFGGVNKTIDFGDLGYCGGSFTYKDCFHCAKTVIYEDELIINCEFEVIAQDSGEEGESSFWSKTSKCNNCGLVYETGELTYVEPGCKKIIVRAHRFSSPDGELIIEGNRYEGGENHEFEHEYSMLGESCKNGVLFRATCINCGKKGSEIVFDHLDWVDKSTDLSELGMCGEDSVFLYSTCPCGELEYAGINDATEANCNWDIKITSYTDDSGELHTVKDMHCSVCDSDIRLDSKEIIDEGCNFNYLIDTSIVIKGKTVIDGTFVRGGEVRHDYEYTYKLYGESCLDGTNFITVTCKRCGESYEYMSEGHVHDEKKSYDLTKYGICGEGSEFYFSTCPCGEETQMYTHHSDQCEIYDVSSGYYIDEQGNEVSSITQACRKCELSITNYEYIVPQENCTAVKYKKAILSKGETVLVETERLACENLSEYHVWKYNYTPLGSACEDGIRIEMYCGGCDLKGDPYIENDHVYIGGKPKVSMDLDVLGMCGEYSIFEIVECVICGEEHTECSYASVCCRHEEHSSYSTLNDENGIKHTIKERNCCYCNFTIIEDSYEIENVKMIKLTIIKNDETVIEYTFKDSDQ